jgi:hypothetical protein
MGEGNPINGRCTTIVTWGRTSGPCGMLPTDSCHRLYRCRQGCTLLLTSCESRDRHEANVHGDGW